MSFQTPGETSTCTLTVERPSASRTPFMRRTESSSSSSKGSVAMMALCGLMRL